MRTFTPVSYLGRILLNPFARPASPPDWQFAYTIGLSLGCKYTTEGFYLVDIIDHLTDEYPLELLKEGEHAAGGV